MHFKLLSLTVAEAPTPTDRIAELEEQLDSLRDELNDTRAELKEATDAKMDAVTGYAILAAVLAVLAVSLVAMVRRK